MDKAALVALDFAIGAKTLKILDQSDLDISLAMWLHAAEYGDWRFALSSKQFIREMRRATGKRKINSETHLASQMIADRFVEEALIYRLQ